MFSPVSRGETVIINLIRVTMLYHNLINKEKIYLQIHVHPYNYHESKKEASINKHFLLQKTTFWLIL